MANIQSGTGNSVRTDFGSRLNALDWVAMILLIVGGVNWALVGLFNYDLVASILGVNSLPSRVVYIVVGLAAVYSIYLCVRQSRPETLAGT